jgi:hypothetical protein
MGINEANISLVELYIEHNQKLRELIGKSFTAATLARHETSMKHVIVFMHHKYNNIIHKRMSSHKFTILSTSSPFMVPPHAVNI